MKRTSGILLHITSLPSDYGIGDLGTGAKSFVDLLSKAGCSWWQILPLCPSGMGNSPYTSFSAFAGNELLISPDELVKKGLIEKGDLEKIKEENPYVTNYDKVKETKISVLRKAYLKVDSKIKKEIKIFEEENKEWLNGYAYFMAKKTENNDSPWWEWDEKEPGENEINFWKFAQYEFYSEWNELKTYANEKGVGIIGDMPIYVSLDSADVMEHREIFDLDKKGRPKKVAGVPPDAFSADGQLWGNPLYNWKKLKTRNYDWWIKRIGFSLKIYDVVRIDHFIGFYKYWAVPAGEKTAKNGKWMKGPSSDLFDLVNRTFDGAGIIAEDLGTADSGFADFLKKTGYPGMKVLHFAFDPSGDNENLPHNYNKNCVAYTGTHDNNTTLGWLWESDAKSREFALDYCNFSGDWGMGGTKSGSVRQVIRTLWQSPADTVIIPVQDLLGTGADTRMNIPGKADGNWEYRVSKQQMSEIDVEWLKKLNIIYRRNSR